jgi:hypothetical protein
MHSPPRFLVPVLVLAACTGQIEGAAVTTSPTAGAGAASGSGGSSAAGTGGAAGTTGGAPGSGGAGAAGSGGAGGSSGATPLPGPPLRSASARRLTRQELARSIQRLFGADVPVDVSLLPADTLNPFDNDVLEQSPSMLLAEGTETLARDVAVWLTATPERMARLVPCTPASPADAACFRQVLQRLGRRVLRRPVTEAELTELGELISYAASGQRFADAIRVALRVLLLHPEFLHRVEPGVSTSGGRVRLSAFEVASRLSFLLQGMTPDDQLLNAAETGGLDTPADLEAQARRLLESAEGQEQVRRFHAFWLGYSTLDMLPIQQKLRAETDALVDRATERGRDYRYLLLADETRIDAELAAHYGLTGAAAAPGWVSYGGAPRRGILSHGMFAAAGAKFTDTSPTRRGKFIRERLLCQVVPLPPPEVSVDVDLPPAAKDPAACKVERYRQHREDAACASCHAAMDPIGFGLENFDELGRYRAHDKDRAACAIDGKGSLDERTPFTGARELASLLAAAPELPACVGQHFIRFAAGRALDDDDVRRGLWLGGEMQKANHSFAAMVLAYVTHADFRFREE